eukprot:CAMPEP_0194278584 /NCGR_PEP_ID=MMETSP0169-20130528/11725_1 /TAXON_ID=218684 /ORGANISM="Corethron pennatum, Strain L29A3" /LENGTH=564 /DNA_ID=CAMNT_0039022809 /DNA_START=135 /DNA_END=1826 /DNA_ORIENTATION=+
MRTLSNDINRQKRVHENVTNVARSLRLLVLATVNTGFAESFDLDTSSIFDQVDSSLPELIESLVTPSGSLEALVSELEYDPCQDDDFFTSNIGGQIEMTCEWLKEQSTDTREDFCPRSAAFEGKIKEVFRFCPMTCKFDCLQKIGPALPVSVFSINPLLEDTPTSSNSTYSPTATLKPNTSDEGRGGKQIRGRKSEKNKQPKRNKDLKTSKESKSKNIKDSNNISKKNTEQNRNNKPQKDEATETKASKKSKSTSVSGTKRKSKASNVSSLKSKKSKSLKNKISSLKNEKSKSLKNKKSKEVSLKNKKSKELKSKSKSKDSKSKSKNTESPTEVIVEVSNAPTEVTIEVSNAPTDAPTFGEKSEAAAGKAFAILDELKNDLRLYYDLLLPQFHAFLNDFLASIAVIEEALENVFARVGGKAVRRLQKTRQLSYGVCTQTDLLAQLTETISSAFEALVAVLDGVIDLSDSIAGAAGLLDEFEKATEGFTNPPTKTPTDSPTEGPTEAPTEESTDGPTAGPTEGPTGGPTEGPTEGPTGAPTGAPTEAPTNESTSNPTTSSEPTTS